MNTAKLGSIVLAVATIGSALFLAATGHISWSDATPMIAGGAAILGIHFNLPNTTTTSSNTQA